MPSKKRRGRVHSIQKRIAIIYILVFTAFLSFLGGMTYVIFQKTLTQQVMTDHEHLLKQSQENIDLLVSNINYAFVYMSADQYTAEILNHQDLDTVSAYNYIRLLKQQFTNFIDLPATDLNTVYRAYLFLNPNEPLAKWLPSYNITSENMESGVYNTDAVKDASWYRQAVETHGELVFTVQKDEDKTNEIYISKLIINPYIFSDSIGVALFVVSPNAFAQQIQMPQYAESTTILLTDNHKNVIYNAAPSVGTQPSSTDILQAVDRNQIDNVCKTVSINGEPYIISCNQLQWGWYMISAVPYSSLTSRMRPVLYMIILILIIVILLGAFFVIFAAKKISKPIIMLTKTMEDYNAGEVPNLPDVKLPNDEVSQLYASFADMTSRIQTLIEGIKESHNRQLQAEYDALQAQINPHFLYNTLNSINWMVIMRKEYDISNAISALSAIMQYSISRRDSEATIADELQHVEKFMVIEKLHYGEKVQYSCTVSEACNDCMVPKIILQPLVENSIIHGIACKNGSGYIQITGDVIDGLVKLQVTDNGVGVDAEQMNQRLKNEDLVPAKEHGIGVVNVNNRIRMMFGEQYGLIYSSNEEGGTTVTVQLPAIKKSPQDKLAGKFLRQ
ncbi:sensor histidine kinase [Thermocaproicibacter melissae]|uniref:sensor histidine kinase n=1 Tax=Thermocaproicibacter melissae TaxID=2966552 RepID=UPI0024B0F2B7|nr:sensor histidine kinase [Thermocaproicibacter melissae]WBY63969.1 sensor histidine kinase [Thermocaproicibacter melissae]